MKCFWIFNHDYTRWQYEDIVITYVGTKKDKRLINKEEVQSRACMRCGRKQARRIRI